MLYNYSIFKSADKEYAILLRYKENNINEALLDKNFIHNVECLVMKISDLSYIETNLDRYMTLQDENGIFYSFGVKILVRYETGPGLYTSYPSLVIFKGQSCVDLKECSIDDAINTFKCFCALERKC